jgi:Reverse transcriptase (RNA-dependent DNA polymerase)
LTTSYNQNPLEHMERTELAFMAQMTSEQTALIANFTDGNDDPVNYNQVKHHVDRKEWWKAMCTEFENIEKKKVWEIVEKENVPKNRQIIGNRWVYVKKDDGRFRARTVAKGYHQIPGKDFQENHAPVVNDTTFHMVLVWKVLFKLMAGQFDIETAFLYGDLDEDIWMVFPDGYEDYLQEVHHVYKTAKLFCVKLNKALYGLVQAARQWWKKFKEKMLLLGYKPSEADPCLFVKKNQTEKVISFIILYVDDGGIIGTQETIDELVSGLSEDFKVKYLGQMEHFVGCRLIENKSKDTLWIHQPKLIKNLKLHFQQLVDSVKFYKTPAMPRTVIVRPSAEENKLNEERQTKYRSGVGMLLYLVKHSRPDIANSVRELSKVADGATEMHWKALLRVIKYVLSTENHGLKIKPTLTESFYMEGISDSEYAGDKDNRISVYGYVLYFCGAPIAWKSKAGKSVTLSSTEAEYVASSEIAKEAIFVKNLLDSIGIEIELPIKIRVDNVGAIYLANNYSTSQRTKHIDIRAHFLREYIENGILKVEFIRSEDIDADILTKNTSEELFHLHAKKNVEEITELVKVDTSEQ